MYLWIDLETTGLDAEHDYIVEVGWFITRESVWHTRGSARLVTPNKDAWELMAQDPVRSMHEKSGLLNALANNHTLMIEDVEDEILEDVVSMQARYPDEPVILAGASVHFDRGFIRNWMPRLEAELSHRHFDVSVLRMLFREAGYGDIEDTNHETAHRAFHDIVDSYILYRRYLDKLNEIYDFEHKPLWRRMLNV